MQQAWPAVPLPGLALLALLTLSPATPIAALQASATQQAPAPAAAARAGSGTDPAALAAFAAQPAVTGSEAALLRAIEARLTSPGLHLETDAFGTLIVRAATAAPGAPVTAVLAVGLDEPGYVVSQIRDDGYLRLRFLGRSATPAFHLAHEGQPVLVLPGSVPGVILVNSIHLRHPRPAQLEESDLWLDVGADSPADVAALGIELLDPVVAREVTTLHDGCVAAPALGRRAAALALLTALADVPPAEWREGLAVAFVAQSLPGSGPLGRGGEGLLRRLEPAQVLVLRARETEDAGGTAPAPARSPLTVSAAAANGAAWSALELRVRHADTPVETVSPADLAAFTAALRAELAP